MGDANEQAEAPTKEEPRPTNRIRVQLTYELSIHEPGFPDWLDEIVPAGIGTLIDEKRAQGPVIDHGGARYQFAVVSPAALKRRATKRQR